MLRKACQQAAAELRRLAGLATRNAATGRSRPRHADFIPSVTNGYLARDALVQRGFTFLSVASMAPIPARFLS